MLTIDPDKRLHIAVGIIQNSNNEYLIAQRAEHSLHAGKWEFPGGKVEQSESVIQALNRELSEELAIIVLESSPLLKLDFDYPQRRVCLDVWMVDRYEGRVSSNEGQRLNWVDLEQIEEIGLLEANHLIVKALKDKSST